VHVLDVVDVQIALQMNIWHVYYVAAKQYGLKKRQKIYFWPIVTEILGKSWIWLILALRLSPTPLHRIWEISARLMAPN